MARIRTIKPSFFSSLTVAALPVHTRLTFIGLWTYVDDDGRAIDDPRLVKAEVWPLDDKHTPRKINGDLDRLAAAELIERYEVDGRRYLRITNWVEHQRISKPQPSKLPPPPDPQDRPEGRNGHGEGGDESRNVQGTSEDGSRLEGKGREGNSSSSSSDAFDNAAPPVGEEDEIQLPGGLWDQFADRKLAMANGVKNPSAWKAEVARNAAANPDLAAYARRMWARYDLSVDRLAAAVLGYERGEAQSSAWFTPRQYPTDD